MGSASSRHRWLRGGHRWLATLAAVLVAAAALPGCAPTPSSDDGAPLKVVTTTGILADLVRNVGGDLVDVTALVPPGADPHSYEPSLRNVRDVVYADVAFSNYLLLEEQSIVRMLEANLNPTAEHIMVAEKATQFGATVIPMVENRALDTTWLGLRVRGAEHAEGLPRSAKVTLGLTGVEGPGDVAAFVTESFGSATAYWASRDGVDAHDVVSLPLDAHTHVSWGFTEPGIYRLDVSAYVHADGAPIGTATASEEMVFAVGVDPSEHVPDRRVLDNVHADLTVDVATRSMVYQLDDDITGDSPTSEPSPRGAQHQHSHTHAGHDDVKIDAAVVAVPTSTLTTVPANPAFSFIDRPGQPVYMLAQAVLGKHVHGEIDPHLWLDASNAAAYVDLIAHELSRRAPEHRHDFMTRSQTYRAELLDLHEDIRSSIATIPRSRRHLVTNHDSFAYFADAYGLRVAGFVTPNPATEPSMAQRLRLAQTISDLDVRAVFLEPTARTQSATLEQVAADAGVAVCDLLSDSFTEDHATYVDMMRFNTQSLQRCLGS